MSQDDVAMQVWVELEKSGEDLHMNFPITIATCPFRIPNSTQQPLISYGKRDVCVRPRLIVTLHAEPCCDHCEGGIYIGPEFQLGQVYDGSLGLGDESGETICLYRPLYVCVKAPPTRPANPEPDASAGDLKIIAQKSNGVE